MDERIPDAASSMDEEAASAVCTKCKRTLPMSAFTHRKRGTREYQCKECRAATERARFNEDNPRPKKAYTLHPRAPKDSVVDGIIYRRCGTCKEVKPLDEGFHWRNKAKGERQPRCKSCALAATRKYNARNPEATLETWRRYRRDHYLRLTYGITEAEYWALYAEQGEACAICGHPGGEEEHAIQQYPLHIDHCHETGVIRGLLCRRCNTSLGQFRDDPEVIFKAALYVERHNPHASTSQAGEPKRIV